jgi:rubredoxin
MVSCHAAAWQTTPSFFWQWRDFGVSAGKYRTYMCIICGWVYDEEKGAPSEGLAPGTRWEDIPADWVCPDCGASKEDFDLMQL